MSKAASLVGLTLQRTKELGLKGAVKQIMKTNIIRPGNMVGRDAFGNTYFEALKGMTINGRERWVEGATTDFDPSQIPAEWHRWLHYISDEVPDAKRVEEIKYRAQHHPNFTGSELAYRPNSYFYQKHYKPIESKIEELGADDLNAELAKKKQ